MDVTPHELRDCQITDAFRGYNRDEVNELMERAAATIETQAEKIRILTERVSTVTTGATRTRDNEDIIQRTLILAQRAADEAVEEATRKAEDLLHDAETRSRALIDTANDEVRRVHDVERARLDAEIRDLAARRDGLHGDVEALEAWEREYRGRLIGRLEADLATARAKKAITPPAPPIPRVEQPAPASTEAGAPPAPTPTPVAPAAPATNAPADEASVAARAATPSPAPAPAPAPAPPVPAPAQRAPAAQGDDAIDLTRDRGRSEDGDAVEAVPVSAGIAVAKPLRPATPGEAAAPLAGSAARSAPKPAAPVQDARLDDDAFFATLRDAVRDDAPLGPADDRLFENERDSSLRDIFKRKR